MVYFDICASGHGEQQGDEKMFLSETERAEWWRQQFLDEIVARTALTKERDEAVANAKISEAASNAAQLGWGKDIKHIAALVSVIQDADSWMSLLWHRGKPDDAGARLKIEKTLGDLRRISNGENISKVISNQIYEESEVKLSDVKADYAAEVAGLRKRIALLERLLDKLAHDIEGNAATMLHAVTSALAGGKESKPVGMADVARVYAGGKRTLGEARQHALDILETAEQERRDVTDKALDNTE